MSAISASGWLPPGGGTEAPSAAFLRWALPHIGLTWSGFRRVRRQVWRRIGRRIAELRLSGPAAYRAYLESHPEEWATFDACCRIPISRFFRDREVFDRLGADVLPSLAEAALRRGDQQLRLWSAGCASGEEPYSIALLWRFGLAPRFPTLGFYVLATDVEEPLLARARAGRYRRSSLREFPRQWLDAAFTTSGQWFDVRPEYRAAIDFRCGDLRRDLPDGVFDLILCRNLVCTYFDEPLQRRTLARMLTTLRPGGAFVIGRSERLPSGLPELVASAPALGIYRKRDAGAT